MPVTSCGVWGRWRSGLECQRVSGSAARASRREIRGPGRARAPRGADRDGPGISARATSTAHFLVADRAARRPALMAVARAARAWRGCDRPARAARSFAGRASRARPHRGGARVRTGAPDADGALDPVEVCRRPLRPVPDEDGDGVSRNRRPRGTWGVVGGYYAIEYSRELRRGNWPHRSCRRVSPRRGCRRSGRRSIRTSCSTR